MSKQKQNCYKTKIGGQAVMEGVMMRSSTLTGMAVRLPDGTIDEEIISRHGKKNIFEKIPVVRGCVSFVKSMLVGISCLMKSAEKLEEEPAQAAEAAVAGADIAGGAESAQAQEPKAPEKKKTGDTIMLVGTLILGVALALGLFSVLPTLAVGGLERLVPLGYWKTVIEGVLKIAILVTYMWAVSKMKEIRRVFEYHGAEHKSIACFESGDELTVENARKHTRFHPRCGTSFLFLVMFIGILVNALLPWANLGLRVVYKILLLPVVAGLSYELIQLAGRHDNVFTRIISAPGLWLQHITTVEPDDSQLEVALAALRLVLPEKKEDETW